MEEKVEVRRPKKSPALAGILSFFFPGVGSLYNTQYLKGLLTILIFAGLITMQRYGQGQPFLGILLGGLYIFQIIDSVQSANIINRRALAGEGAGKEEEELVLGVKSGSIFWGLVLIALGGILLLANFEVISYDKLFDFWPLAIIVVGLKLIADYFSKKK
jgi:hypothetical protein